VRRLDRIGRALATSRPTKPRRIRVESTLDLVPVLSPQWGRPNHLAPVFERLDRVPYERVRACIAIPPRHFKSTTAHHWVARLLERYGWMKILYLSYNVTFAAENSAAIQALALRAGVELGRVQRQERWTTSEGGGLWSASFDSPLTGRGFHLIIIDDPHQNRAEAESAVIRAKTNKAVRNDVITRGQPDGPKAWPRGFPGTSIVVFATRWHEDDVTGNLIGTSPNALPNAKRFEYFCFPAIDEEGRPLAPDYWTLESLRELQAGMLHYDWVSLYQGRPEPSGGRLFGDVVLIDPSAIPREGRFGIGVDLARTAKQRSDSHAVCAMQRTGDEYFIRDMRSKQSRLTSEDRVDANGTRRYVPGFVQDIRAMQSTYGGARTAQHIGGPEDFTLDLLSSLEKSERVHIEGLRAKASKRERAMRFITDWNHGRVKLPLGAPWVDGFVSKVISFTGEEGGADDEIDAAVTAHALLQDADPTILSDRVHDRTGFDRPSVHGATVHGASTRRRGMW
jgi:phage terminase large subunit-like protein